MFDKEIKIEYLRFSQASYFHKSIKELLIKRTIQKTRNNLVNKMWA